MTTKFSPNLQTMRTSASPTYQPVIPVDSQCSAGHNRLSELEINSYQIALVPSSGSYNSEGAADGVVDKVLLLPLTWAQLLRRMRRESGGSKSTDESRIVQFGQVRIDLLAMEVQRADCQVSLTTMEFKVLRFFVLNPNRVISRDELLNQVWGYNNYPCTRTVDNHILKLRQKLEEEASHPVHFRTVHGIGYKFIA